MHRGKSPSKSGIFVLVGVEVALVGVAQGRVDGDEVVIDG